MEQNEQKKEEQPQLPEYYYKCGKCRQTLFNDSHLIKIHEFTPKANYSYKRHNLYKHLLIFVLHFL